jgi:hypothetical protein
MTKKDLKKVAKETLESVLGFAPSFDNIILLETGHDTIKVYYLLFMVKGIDNINYRINYNVYDRKYNLDIIKVDVEDDYNFTDEINF